MYCLKKSQNIVMSSQKKKKSLTEDLEYEESVRYKVEYISI